QVQFQRKFFRIKRAAGKIAPGDFERRYFAEAVICFQNDLFGGLVFFDVHFAVRDASFPQEGFRVPAIRAPVRGVSDDVFHSARAFAASARSRSISAASSAVSASTVTRSGKTSAKPRITERGALSVAP